MADGAIPLRTGIFSVVPPAALEQSLQKQAEDKVAAERQASATELTSIAGFIRTQFEIMRNHRNDASAGWSERLLVAMRSFNGVYDNTKLAEIRKFGGSEIYARLIASKCRGASSLLRDIYLAQDRSWSLDPPADPKVPPEIEESIMKLLQTEIAGLQQSGGPLDPKTIKDRALQLAEAAREAAKRKGVKQANLAEEKIQNMLVEGGFYKALAEFLVDLPLFPFACIKGPEVRIIPSVVWTGQQATVQMKPKLCWARVSPFDVWWTPGVADIEDAAVIEKCRVTRGDLNDVLDLPGYQREEVRAVLDEYGRGGLSDHWDTTDAERATMEGRENPLTNRSNMITMLKYAGNVQGRTLHEYGIGKDQAPDELRDYACEGWLIGSHVIKLQMSPSPRKRHSYYITSFEKVPGTPLGNALPDIMADMQEVCNAAARSLVNNLSISSGPQVVINDDRIAPGADGESLYAWKRWHVNNDPMGNNAQVPISFFQPNSNAQELLSVYQAFENISDEVSGIPRFMGGQGAGGLGRTASGLALMMGNSSKILQTVAANVDRDIFEPLLGNLFDLIMLTDKSGMLTGEEDIRVRGVDVALQHETQRSRQIEFLTATANPMDAQIVGMKGRASILRSISKNLGLDGEEIVPSAEEIEQKEKVMKEAQAAMAQMGAAAQGGQAGPGATQQQGPATNVVQPRIQGGV